MIVDILSIIGMIVVIRFIIIHGLYLIDLYIAKYNKNNKKSYLFRMVFILAWIISSIVLYCYYFLNIIIKYQ